MEGIKTLLFGPGLLQPTLDRRKHITLRRYRPEAHDFAYDEPFFGKFAEGPRIALMATADTEVKTFGDITDDEAREDGFADAADMLRGMRSHYPDLKPTDRAAIIRFEVARDPDGTPFYYDENGQRCAPPG